MRVRAAILLLLLVVAGVAAWSYFRPIPAVAATGSLPASEVIAGTPPALPWPARRSAAVSAQNLTFIGRTGSDQAKPPPTPTNLMTPLHILAAHPPTTVQSPPTT